MYMLDIDKHYCNFHHLYIYISFEVYFRHLAHKYGTHSRKKQREYT